MSDYRLTIEKAENGYIVSHPDELDDGTPVTYKDVIEIPEQEWGECDAGLSLLYFVMEFFGLLGSKHDKKRLVAEIRERKQ